MMSILTIGVGWAEVYSYDLKKDNPAAWTTSGNSVSTSTTDGFSFVVTNGGGSAQVTNIIQSTHIRLYQNATMTITPPTGEQITNVVLYHNGSSYQGTLYVDNNSMTLQSSTGNYGAQTWSGSATDQLVITASAQCRVNKIEITTSEGGTPTCAKPTFSPAAGSYYESQHVTISCATEGADILWGYNGETFGSYDGDPILVNETMTLYAYAAKSGMNDSEIVSADYTITGIPTKTLPYEEGFSNGFGTFYVKDVVNPGFDVWETGSYSGTTYAKATAYKNGTNNVSESWLISPYIDLSAATAPELSFSQAINNHFVNSIGTLWVKERGAASDWTQITITYPETPSSSYSDFVAQTIDLTTYKGKTIQIGFKYASTADAAGAWEVADVKVEEKPLDKAYYLKGSFNSWGDGIAFTKVNDNMYILRNQEVAANMEFKILNESNEYLGGQDGNAPYDITNSWFRDLPLEKDKQKNFRIVNAGTYDFIIKINDQGVATLFVPQTTDLYLKGSFDGWTDGAKFTRNEDGSYTLTGQVLAEASTFKIYDMTGEYYSGDNTNITENETTITLQDGGNISIPAGKWTFNIDIAKTTMVVSRVLTTHTVTVDIDPEANGTVTVDKATATVGETVALTVKPDNGYMVGKVSAVMVDGEEELGEVNIADDLTFVMPDADVVVSADFEKIEIPDGDYKKITSTQDLTSGIYLIVYEDGSLAFNGGLTDLDVAGNSISVEIKGDMVVSTEDVDAATFTYDASVGTLKSASGFYIGQTTDANGLKASETQAYTNTVSIDENGNADVVASGGAYLRYNAANNDKRFRYYKSSTYTSQKAIQLYKKTDEHAPTLPTPEINGETPFVGTTAVTIIGGTEGGEIHYTLDGSEPTLESTLCEDIIILDKTTTVKAIVYKHVGEGVYEHSAVASKEFVKAAEIENLTAFYAYEGTDAFGFTGNLVAIAQTGKYLYAQDDAKGVLIYGETGRTYNKGNKIPANFIAEKTANHGAPQMTNPLYMMPATESATIEPIELTIAKASQENQEYLYRYAVIKNAKYQDSKLSVDDAELAIYKRFETEVTPVDGKVYDVTGIVSWYDGAQFMPLEYVEVLEPVVLDGVSFGEGHNWATWFGDENYVVPEGVTAYTVTAVSGENVTVEEVDYIPAGVGILLFSESAMESVIAMPCDPDAKLEDVESELKGMFEDGEVEDVYLLYNNEFVLAQNGTTLPAHRCYLQIPEDEDVTSAPRVLRIAVGGTVTSIDDLRYDSNGKTVRYYDLTGRYVGTSLNGKRGIFITSDGKKVVR